MKTILVILDGAADLPAKTLNNLTPLEAANTPNMDNFAKNGKTGLIYPVNPSVAPESDAATIAILGYDPYKYFARRGPLEAAGVNINLTGDFLAIRANFATCDEELEITDRRAGRTLSRQEAEELTKAINEQVKLPCKFTFKNTLDHRGVLVLNGKYSTNVTDVDPAYKRVGEFGIEKMHKNIYVQRSMPLNKNATNTAAIINEFIENSHEILKNHPINKKRKKQGKLPANVILLRDPGNQLPQFPKKEKWVGVLTYPLERGIASLAGIKTTSFLHPCSTSKDKYQYFYECLRETIKSAKKLLSEKFNDYDVFYIHLKETDLAGHDGFPNHKKRMLEIIDSEFISYLNGLDARIVITCDHSTPCSRKEHTYHPVPLLIHGEDKDEVDVFSEQACRIGSIGRIRGVDLIRILQK